MTTEEKFRAENISLKNEKAQLLTERLQREADDIAMLKRQAFNEAIQLKKDICARLNVSDPSKIALRADGNIEEKA